MHPRRAVIFLYALLLTTTAALYFPMHYFQFLNWDDRDMVLENPLLNPPTLDHLRQLWAGPHLGLYAPLSYSAWWVVSRIMPGDARTFHLLNILLHLASATLVMSILRRLTASTLPAFAGAMLFALHPFQVESVAWIAEMNNLLAGALSLATLRLYLACSDADGKKHRPLYFVATITFILALFAKPSAVVIPLIALILETGFLHRRLRTSFRFLLPWFCFAAIFSLIARNSQTVSNPFPWRRPFIALDAIGFYLLHLIWPANLTIDYHRGPAQVWENRLWIFPAVLTIGIAISLWRLRKPQRGFAFAGLVTVAALLPALGFIPFTFQNYSTVADRYMYLAMLGPAIALALLLKSLDIRAAVAGTIIISVLLSVLTEIQLQHWRDTDALAAYTLRLDPQSTLGNKIKAAELARDGHPSEAVAYYRVAMVRHPNEVELHYNCANALYNSGQAQDAMDEYRQTLALGATGDARLRTLYSLGVACMATGQFDAAVIQFENLLRLDPQNAQALRNLQFSRSQRVPTR